MTPDFVNDNGFAAPTAVPARLQAAFAVHYAPTPRAQVLLLTRAASPRAPATWKGLTPLRGPFRLTPARLRA